MRRLEERIVINTSQQAVWDVLADFGNPATWAPGMRQSSLKGKQKIGVGTQRIMRHAWGFNIEETVTQWIDGAGFSFKLDKAPFPLCDVCETWVLRHDDIQTMITTTVSYGTRLGLIGILLDAMLVRFLVAREMRSGIAGLKQYVEKKFVNTF